MKDLFYVVVMGVVLCCMGCGDSEPSLEEYITENNITAEAADGYYYDIEKNTSEATIVSNQVVEYRFEQRNFNNEVLNSNISSDISSVALFDEFSSLYQEQLVKLDSSDAITFYISHEDVFNLDEGGIVQRFEIDDTYPNLSTYNTQKIESYIAAEGLDIDTVTAEGIYIASEVAGFTADTMAIVDLGSDAYERPASNALVQVSYSGNYLHGEVFDSSNGTPISFNLNGVIEGWQIAIPYFGRGGRGTIIIPSNLAYGNDSSRGIPPHSPLVFEIELVDFE